MMTTLFVDVIVPLPVPNKYTYRVPSELNDEVTEGKRVLVQFGKTKIYTAVIARVHEQAPKEYVAKYIEALLDDVPVVTDIQLMFWEWIAFYYCAYPGDVMNAALPSGLKLSSTSHIQLHPDLEAGYDPSHFSDKELRVLESLAGGGTRGFEQIAEMLKVKSAHALINSLLRKSAVLVYEDVRERYKPKLETYLRITESMADDSTLRDTLNRLEKRAFKQAEALLYFLHLRNTEKNFSGWLRKNELLKKTEPSAIAGLIRKKIFEEKKIETGRLLFAAGKEIDKTLGTEQLEAYEKIRQIHSEKKVALLHGVTGSGKTEIYLKLIGDALDERKQVLYLLPEIALTVQLIERLRAAFGELVGVYHSRFSENERVEIWQNILQSGRPGAQKKHYRVIVGARSALFLPFRQLGLIIIDEEHDNSFKQHDPSPRYHARDAAIYLSSLHDARVVLGSATPAVESYLNARQGKYGIAELKSQYVKGGGTRLEVCDVNYYRRSNQMKASLTPPLFEAMQKALDAKRQVILFQNRRGFAPYTECRQCGHVPQCIQCDVSLIYHKQQQKLVCHYCGYSIPPPKTCVACGSNQLHYRGLGTEKIEEEIEILFPEAKIARMDLDSTRSRYAYKQLLDDFESGATQILIGTQMVTKGLDFGNVSVVGVLNADSLFNFPDFRAFEKAYQLLTQVRGRAGRGYEKGSVYVQTTQPDHKVIELLRGENYKTFFEYILAERKQYHYPPFTRLLEITLISRDAGQLDQLCGALHQLLQDQFRGQLLGPEYPLIPRIKNQYHKRILVKLGKSQGTAEVRQAIFRQLGELQLQFRDWRYRVSLDVDPV